MAAVVVLVVVVVVVSSSGDGVASSRQDMNRARRSVRWWCRAAVGGSKQRPTPTSGRLSIFCRSPAMLCFVDGAA
ncbi:uncharacterized protein IWZ02DRAFT_34902 [Phyllosticta citriasiana]|uniref:uncharacterized protein n=1 Tax=Phyllosticta citriasiana TaxID=595635 RepID=UPI0030FD59CA